MYIAEQNQAELTCGRCGYAVPWCAILRLLTCQRTGQTKRPQDPCDYLEKERDLRWRKKSALP